MKKKITLDFYVPEFVDSSQIAHTIAEHLPKYAFVSRTDSTKYKVRVELVRAEPVVCIEVVGEWDDSQKPKEQ